MSSILDERFAVLHVLAIKGMITGPLAARVTGLPDREARHALDALTEEGAATFAPARQAWRVTAAGRRRHRELLADDMDDGTRARLRAVYEEFLPLNGRFKALCTSWQMRAGVPNDHADTGYDTGLVAELGKVHDAAARLVGRMSALRPRFTGYAARFTDAVGRVRAGDHTAFTGVLTDSYHDVWMDLHRDLLLSLGLERSARDG